MTSYSGNASSVKFRQPTGFIPGIGYPRQVRYWLTVSGAVSEAVSRFTKNKCGNERRVAEARYPGTLPEVA